MRALIFLWTFFFIQFPLFSQSNDIVNELFFTQGIDFSVSKVIDNRSNKESIGNHTDKIKKIVFPEQFETYLLKSINQKTKQNAHVDLSFVMIVNKFEIRNVNSSGSPASIFELELEFAKEVDSKFLSKGIFESISIKTASNTSIPGTIVLITVISGDNIYSEQITKGIENCFSSFILSNYEITNSTIVDLDSKVSYTYDFTHFPYDGLYCSYGNMAHGNPLLIKKFRILQKNTSKKFPIFKLECDSIEDLGLVKFVSDGENLFINSNKLNLDNDFVQALELGRYSYFECKYMGRAEAAILDSETGRALILNDYNLYNAAKPHSEILKAYRSSRRKLADKRVLIAAINKKLEGLKE